MDKTTELLFKAIELSIKPGVSNEDRVVRIKNALEAIEKGANVNARDKDGDTPLHLAVRFNDLEMVKLLLDNGSDITVKDMYGETPLDWAANLRNMNKTAKEIEKLLNEKREKLQTKKR